MQCEVVEVPDVGPCDVWFMHPEHPMGDVAAETLAMAERLRYSVELLDIRGLVAMVPVAEPEVSEEFIS
jgi:hypothetical protein